MNRKQAHHTRKALGFIWTILWLPILIPHILTLYLYRYFDNGLEYIDDALFWKLQGLPTSFKERMDMNLGKCKRGK